MNLNPASCSSASQFYREDIYLCISRAVFALAIPFFSGFEDCKDGGLQRIGLLRKCSLGYPYLYQDGTSRSNLFLQNFGHVELGCSVDSSLSSASCRLRFSPESGGAFVARFQKKGTGKSAVNRPTSHFSLQSMPDTFASIPERLELKLFLCHQNLQYMAHFHWHSLSFPRNAFCGVLNLNLAEFLWFLSCTDIPSAGAAGTVKPQRAAY